MSIQDPPFGNPNTDRPAGGEPAGTSIPDRTSTIPPADAEKLQQAKETVRNDLGSAWETAKSDLGALADTAKRDFAAVKDEALSQLQGLQSQAGGQAQSIKDQADQQFRSLKSQAQDQYRNVKGEAENQLGEAADKAKSYATEQVSHLADQARSFASQQKDLAARQFGGVVDAVSRVADELSANQDNTAVAGYARDLAGGLRQVADTVQNKSVDELFSMVQDFGRRQPLAFLGIAALTGFAASRFILASRSREVPAPATQRTDRAFDDQVLRNQGYDAPSRTAVELERSESDIGRADLGARGVGDNGRI